MPKQLAVDNGVIEADGGVRACRRRRDWHRPGAVRHENVQKQLSALEQGIGRLEERV